MNYIKFFEAWKGRFPNKITKEESEKKIRIHGTEPFTQKESDFLNQLFQRNQSSLNYYDNSEFNKGKTYFEVYNMGNIPDPDDPDEDFLIKIDIQKLADDWYILSVSGLAEDNGIFLCDEFNEFEGFLATYTHLKL